MNDYQKDEMNTAANIGANNKGNQDFDTATQAVIEAQDINKTFTQGKTEIPVLTSLDLQVSEGERIAIVGRSGSGKSTLLHVLAGLDDIEDGLLTVGGVHIPTLNASQKAQFRADNMGFVYQHHHLLPEFSALENVSIALRIKGYLSQEADTAAAQLLDEVGLSERLDHLPSQLSGGERQRVAVARALAGQPKLVLADEPTGNLDAQTAEQVMMLIANLSVKHQTAFVVVTHDQSMLSKFDRVLYLHGGKLHDQAG